MDRIDRINAKNPVKCPGQLSLDGKCIYIHLYDLNTPFSHRHLLCLLCFLW